MLSQHERPDARVFNAFLKKHDTVLEDLLDPVQLPRPRPYFEEALIKTITSLREFFPKARIALLGRDSAFLGDLLEFEALTRGESARTERIRVSSELFVLADLQPMAYQLLRQYLLSLALVKGRLPERNSPPFVIIDQSRFLQKSQSYRVLNMLYSELYALGVPAELIVEKIIMLSTADATQKPNLLPLSRENLELMQRYNESSIKTGGNDLVAVTLNLFEHEKFNWSPLSHGEVWTGPYDQMILRKNHIRPESQFSHNAATKLKVLKDLWLGRRLIHSQSFRNKLIQESCSIGFSQK